MAGEPNESAAATTVVEGTTPEPVAASPAAAPAANLEPVAAPVVVEPAPEAPAAPVVEPTLLQKFDDEKAKAAPKAEDKPVEPPKVAEPAKPADPVAAEAPKPEADKPADPVVAAEPAAPVAYEYALPDTIKLDDTAKGEFHAALDALRADPAKGAQGLIDLHNKSMQDYATGLAREQWTKFGETKKGWQTDVMADEELGGAGYETTMGAVARMRDMLVPEQRRDAFNQMLTITGVGDHPEFLRLLHNAARIYDEAPMPPPGPRPPADIGKPQGRGLRGLYKSNQGRQ